MKHTEGLPFVSILLPVRNEANYIESCLKAVLAQDYPANRMEILVADGMSTDGTRMIVDQLAEKHPKVSLRILDNPGKIVATGLNLALRQSRGEIIIRVDGHTMIAPDYVRQCVDALQRTQADNVGGRMNAIGDTPFGEAVALGTSTPFGIGGGRFHYLDKEEWVDTVYMGAWPRRVFEQIGLFDEELVRDQDDEFNYRLRAHGGKILLCPLICSKYMVRSAPPALWRQYYQYGLWKVRVLQKHLLQMSLRQFVPPVFVLVLLVNLFMSFITAWGLGALAFIVFSYLLANLIASILVSKQHGWRYLSSLPLIFATLHISYGFGFLVGLGRFAGRWKDRLGRVPVFSS